MVGCLTNGRTLDAGTARGVRRALGPWSGRRCRRERAVGVARARTQLRLVPRADFGRLVLVPQRADVVEPLGHDVEEHPVAWFAEHVVPVVVVAPQLRVLERHDDAPDRSDENETGAEQDRRQDNHRVHDDVRAQLLAEFHHWRRVPAGLFLTGYAADRAPVVVKRGRLRRTDASRTWRSHRGCRSDR